MGRLWCRYANQYRNSANQNFPVRIWFSSLAALPRNGPNANGTICHMSGSVHMERARTNLAAGMGLRADVPLSLFFFQRIVWMSDRPPTPVLASKIFRFSDVDEFRSSIRNLDVDFTPLARKISAEQIILNLTECDVNYTKSFRGSPTGNLHRTVPPLGFQWTTVFPLASIAPKETMPSSVSDMGELLIATSSELRGNLPR